MIYDQASPNCLLLRARMKYLLYEDWHRKNIQQEVLSRGDQYNQWQSHLMISLLQVSPFNLLRGTHTKHPSLLA